MPHVGHLIEPLRDWTRPEPQFPQIETCSLRKQGAILHPNAHGFGAQPIVTSHSLVVLLAAILMISFADSCTRSTP